GNIDDKGYWDSGCSRHMTGNCNTLIKSQRSGIPLWGATS
ncbi:hypothetical protein Tco_0353916, partial [Tanacetum coccineum]